MSFMIKIPYVIATHVKKFSSVTSLVNKTKAGAIGMISGVLYYNNGVSVVPFGAGGAVASGGAARTLTAGDAGRTNLFDAATTITYTLPAPVVGLGPFKFLWTALETGGQAHVVVTNAASVFLQGAVAMFSGEDVAPSATLGPKMFAGNGTTHLRTTTNGTTTGGGIGSWLEFTCTAATIWTVTGVLKSPSGTIATPFSV